MTRFISIRNIDLPFNIITDVPSRLKLYVDSGVIWKEFGASGVTIGMKKFGRNFFKNNKYNFDKHLPQLFDVSRI